jgi:adenosylhomocysteine nucleosidase
VHSPVSIITPLAFEAQRIRPLVTAHKWPLLVSGPGPEGIRRFADQCRIPAGATVILVGLAGGLNPDLQPGDLIIASEVIDAGGTSLTPTLRLPEATGRLISIDQICRTPADKEQLRAHSGADAVDLESAAFATLAEDRGWNWGILRGISDDASTALPQGCSGWTSPSGRLKPLSLLWSIVKHPGLAMQLPTLGRQSKAAMGAAGHGLIALLERQKNDVHDI